MFLLNLSLAEFLAVFGALSGTVVALYLLDRSRRKQTVATLRFWTASEKATELRRRRKIRQPWSLILQILSIALLLLALAQLRLGSREQASRDHVLILDTSAWMAARSGQGTLMDQAQQSALALLRSLSSTDRVMLVHADALATPVTTFESDRRLLEQAIRRSRPGHSGLNLDQAFRFAGEALRLSGRQRGEIVFAGAGRISERDSVSGGPPPRNLRVLPVQGQVENCGLRKIGLRRSVSDPELWEVYVSARNYGTVPRTVTLSMQFGGAPAGSRRLSLQPGAEQEASFEYRTRAAGLLEARLQIRDDFPEDDRAVLELPARPSVRVAVYSDEPQLLRPVLAAHPLVEAVFLSPSKYDGALDADLVVLDRFAPAEPPKLNAIWIAPPSEQSPVRVRMVSKNIELERWNTEHPLGSGLRSKGLRLESASVFAADPDDIAVAETGGGPVILARPPKNADARKALVFGFHPMHSSLRYELATPLLFANVLRWMSPGIFRRWELTAGSVGTVIAPLDTEADPSKVRVQDERGQALPFTAQDNGILFFTGVPGTVRVLAEDREMVYSLTLPEVAEAVWTPPASVRRGVPGRLAQAASSRDIWQWLALLGGLGLLVEWLKFGRGRTTFFPGAARSTRQAGLKRLGWQRFSRPFRRAS